MEESSRTDIRRLLKTFGVQADEAIISHLARNPGVGPLRLRLTLHDLTDYGDHVPNGILQFEVEGEIRR
ncbi:MAG: hypothetical protein AB1791_08655 [Chloroflexota bacterium]